MPAGLGHLSYLGLGKETSWGTPVAPTVFLPFISCEPTETEERVDDEGIRGTVGKRDTFSGTRSIEISTALNLTPNALAHLLRSLCGPPTSTQPDPTGNPSVWQHVFKFPRQSGFSDECWPWPYTIELFRDIEASARRYAGAALNSLALSVSAEEKVWRAEGGWLGRAWPTTVTKATPTFPTTPPWLWTQTTVTLAGGSNVEQQAIALTFELGLERSYLIDGSQNVAELKPSEQPTLRLSGTALPRSAAEYDRFLNQSTFTVQLVATGGVISGTYSHKVTIDVPVVRYTSYPVPVSGPGRLTAEWEAEAYYDATAGALATITVITNIPNTELA